MKSWTIGKRIIIGGLTLLIAMLVVGGVGLIALGQVRTLTIRDLTNDAIPGIVNMSTLESASLRAQIRIILAGNSTTAEQRARHLAALKNWISTVDETLTAYETTIHDAEDRANFDQLKQIRDAYAVERANYLKLVEADKRTEADSFFVATFEPAFSAYTNQVNKMLKWNQATAGQATAKIVTAIGRAFLLSAIIMAVGVLVATSFGWVIIRSINRALQRMGATLDEAAAQVAGAATQVSSGSQTLAAGASEQAASLEETSSSLEELTSMTKRNAESAGSAKSISTETRHAAEQGNTDMAEMRAAMDSIKSSSADIAKIIKSIDEIAFQTNILALNAAVEAARAGEAGAGFAVVAEEVRALAQRSANSAKETASKIEVAIQNSDHGAQISEKVASSLGVIVGKARRVDELIGEIATASREQTEGIMQINTAVSQMDKVTQSNASSAEETASAAEELNSQAVMLKETVDELRKLVGGADSVARPDSLQPKVTRPAFIEKKPAPLARKSAVPLVKPEVVTASATADHDLNFKDA